MNMNVQMWYLSLITAENEKACLGTQSNLCHLQRSWRKTGGIGIHEMKCISRSSDIILWQQLCSYIRIQEYVKKMGKLENGGFVIPYIFISKIFNPGLEANETDFMMCDSIGWFMDEPAILRDSYDTFPWTVAFGGTSFWVVALDSLRLKQLWGGVLCKNYLGGNFGGAIAYILQDQRLFKQLW